MDDPTDTFNRLRGRLEAIAYRMLGSMAEAEEVVQDVWLRWNDADRAELNSDEAWLVTVATRLSIERLRAAKLHREKYAGLWLPEPVLTDSPATPEQVAELADDVSVAFLAVLERLSPEARAAFLLREVFDMDYSELARAIGKSEASCRQLVHRARDQLREERPRYVVSRQTHQQLVERFATAMQRPDLDAIQSLLAEGAELIGDGGGKVSSFPKPIVGARKIATLCIALNRRYGTRQRIEGVSLNGEWSLLRYFDGVLESAQTFETDGKRILRIRIQRNPDKLSRLVNAISH